MKLIAIGFGLLMAALVCSVCLLTEPAPAPVFVPEVGTLILPVPEPEDRSIIQVCSPQELKAIAEQHGADKSFFWNQFRFVAGAGQQAAYEIDAIYIPEVVLLVSDEFDGTVEHIQVQAGSAYILCHIQGAGIDI